MEKKWERDKATKARNEFYADQLFNKWFHGLAVRTLDSESSNPSSILGGTFFLRFFKQFEQSSIDFEEQTKDLKTFTLYGLIRHKIQPAKSIREEQ